jgi:hypothetical protein
MRQIISPLSGIRSPFGLRNGRFSPAVLFANNEPGVWYDPSDLSTLFQDTAGTTPVTTPGQTVALMLDKSKGLTLGPELVTDPAAATLLGTGTWVDNEDGSFTFTDTVGGQSRPGVSFASSGINKTYEVRFTLVSASTTLRASGVSGGQTIFVSSPGDYKFVTTPTGFGGPIQFSIESTNTVIGSNFRLDNISVKELPGFHATQATAAARPTYGIVPAGGRRNLLTFTEQFDNAAWTKANVTVAANAATAPDGTATADKIVPNNGSAGGVLYVFTPALPSQAYTYTIKVKQSGFTSVRLRLVARTAANAFVSNIQTDIDLTSGTLSGSTSGTWGSATYTSEAVDEGYYIVTISAVSPATTGIIWAYAETATAGDGVAGFFIWGAQLEQSSTATAYQKVTTQFDVTEAGVESLGYLSFDGVDDWMVTPTITPGTDKAQVFAGIRALTGSTRGWVAGYRVATLQQLSLEAPGNVNSVTFSAYTGVAAAELHSLYTAPQSIVAAGIADTDSRQLRVSGSAEVTSTASTGSSDHASNVIGIGRRPLNNDRLFNGQIFSLITRFGPNLEVAQIESTEAYVAGKTAGVDL